jgi:hypothetical protein
MANNLMGTLDGEFLFEVMDSNQTTRRTSQGEHTNEDLDSI